MAASESKKSRNENKDEDDAAPGGESGLLKQLRIAKNSLPTWQRPELHDLTLDVGHTEKHAFTKTKGMLFCVGFGETVHHDRGPNSTIDLRGQRYETSAGIVLASGCSEGLQLNRLLDQPAREAPAMVLANTIVTHGYVDDVKRRIGLQVDDASRAAQPTTGGDRQLTFTHTSSGTGMKAVPNGRTLRCTHLAGAPLAWLVIARDVRALVERAIAARIGESFAFADIPAHGRPWLSSEWLEQQGLADRQRRFWQLAGQEVTLEPGCLYQYRCASYAILETMHEGVRGATESDGNGEDAGALKMASGLDDSPLRPTSDVEEAEVVAKTPPRQADVALPRLRDGKRQRDDIKHAPRSNGKRRRMESADRDGKGRASEPPGLGGRDTDADLKHLYPNDSINQYIMETIDEICKENATSFDRDAATNVPALPTPSLSTSNGRQQGPCHSLPDVTPSARASSRHPVIPNTPDSNDWSDAVSSTSPLDAKSQCLGDVGYGADMPDSPANIEQPDVETAEAIEQRLERLSRAVPSGTLTTRCGGKLHVSLEHLQRLIPGSEASSMLSDTIVYWALCQLTCESLDVVVIDPIIGNLVDLEQHRGRYKYVLAPIFDAGLAHFTLLVLDITQDPFHATYFDDGQMTDEAKGSIRAKFGERVSDLEFECLKLSDGPPNGVDCGVWVVHRGACYAKSSPERVSASKLRLEILDAIIESSPEAGLGKLFLGQASAAAGYGAGAGGADDDGIYDWQQPTLDELAPNDDDEHECERAQEEVGKPDAPGQDVLTADLRPYIDSVADESTIRQLASIRREKRTGGEQGWRRGDGVVAVLLQRRRHRGILATTGQSFDTRRDAVALLDEYRRAEKLVTRELHEDKARRRSASKAAANTCGGQRAAVSPSTSGPAKKDRVWRRVLDGAPGAILNAPELEGKTSTDKARSLGLVKYHKYADRFAELSDEAKVHHLLLPYSRIFGCIEGMTKLRFQEFKQQFRERRGHEFTPRLLQLAEGLGDATTLLNLDRSPPSAWTEHSLEWLLSPAQCEQEDEPILEISPPREGESKLCVE